MDQHPIPQDVTGFQFKLIGTMTVKQFGYVASGVILAVILYYMPIHSALALVKLFLVPLFGVSGVIVAFVPLDGRPIDVMTTNFAKALFSPNQYVYQRHGRKLSFTAVADAKPLTPKQTQEKQQHHAGATTASGKLDEKEAKLRAFLQSSHGQAKSNIDKKEAAFLSALSLPSVQHPMIPAKPTGIHPPITHSPSGIKTAPAPQFYKPAPLPVAPHPLPSAPKAPVLTQPSTTPQSMQKVPAPLPQVKPNPATPPAVPPQVASAGPVGPAATQQVHTLNKQIDDIHAQKQQLEQELSHLKTQLATQKGAPVPQSQPALPKQPLQDPAHVRTISQAGTKKVGLPHISDSPNVVVGIVKDPRGNILPNILVEVKDKEGNPVRAFKTNQLGHFASATPLSPGTYTIALEDPKKQQRFDVIQITTNNQVLLPIEIISHDAREELRKQLFTN
jgi:hypothetical protein